MKTANESQKTIWLFLSLALVLFLATLLSFFDFPGLELSPLKIKKVDNQFLLNKEQPKGLIKWMIFLNKEDSNIYLWLGDYYKKIGDLEKAAVSYQKAIDFAPLLNFENYQKQLEIYEKLDRKKDKENLLEFLSQKIAKPEKFPFFLNLILAKNSYLVGQDYLEDKEEEKALYWWLKARDSLPEWSYFHLEIASLYQQFGQKEKVEEILENCLKYYFPQEHCQQYLENNLENIEEPGFWQEKILDIEP